MDISTTEVIWAAILTIIFIGSWITNKLKGNEDQPASGDSDSDDSDRGRLEELATRRRAEGVRGPSSRPDEPVGVEPQNLTLAERIERARARALYKHRAELLRQKTGSPKAKQGGTQPEPARSQREPIRRPKPVASRPGGATPRHTISRPPFPPQSPVPTPRVPSRIPSTRHKPQVATEEDIVLLSPDPSKAPPPRAVGAGLTGTTLVPEIPEKVPHTRPRSVPFRSGPHAWRGSLQQAIVLKEILDRPLALREPGSSSW